MLIAGCGSNAGVSIHVHQPQLILQNEIRPRLHDITAAIEHSRSCVCLFDRIANKVSETKLGHLTRNTVLRAPVAKARTKAMDGRIELDILGPDSFRSESTSQRH